jgi:hypothetical protein
MLLSPREIRSRIGALVNFIGSSNPTPSWRTTVESAFAGDSGEAVGRSGLANRRTLENRFSFAVIPPFALRGQVVITTQQG